MKLKKWLSRGLVLAMVLALMVPVPVAAKSSNGGKLLKSYKVYEYKGSGRLELQYTKAFTYDKKKNPNEIATTSYDEYLFGVPVSGAKFVETVKYKYKGSTPKSAKLLDGAGKVTETRKYKKGKVVSVVTAKTTSKEVYDPETEAFKGDNISASSSTKNMVYSKKGLVNSYSTTESGNTQLADGTTSSYNESGAYTYAVRQKKGIPSYISTYAGEESYSNSAGDKTYVKWNADGTWIYVDKEGTETGTNDFVYQRYTKFNNKGLAIETGEVKINTKTGVQTEYPETSIGYTFKKGVVTQAIVYSLETNEETGAVTKTTTRYLYKFKYGKTKTSKIRYFNMINSVIGRSEGAFFWY